MKVRKRQYRDGSSDTRRSVHKNEDSWQNIILGRVAENCTNGDGNDDDNLDAVSSEEVPCPSSGSNNIDNHELEVPRNYFFKGFLAWCSWGWKPILFVQE
jgi:hypothetical protein